MRATNRVFAVVQADARASAGRGTAMDRPPPGLRAQDFFETWLPKAYAAARCEAPPDAPLVRVTLSTRPIGGGGQWDVRPIDDRLEITVVPVLETRKAPTPDLWLRQSVADFEAAFDPGPDLPDLLPARLGALDLLFLDDRDRALLRQVSGRILVEVEGKRRRRWALDASFGKDGIQAGRPRSTVRIDGTTYEGVTSGRTAPLQALLQGSIRIEGDRALAMQTMLLLGQRIQR
jgi:hypothetical protein